jgi:Flp pilus assembly protein TadD
MSSNTFFSRRGAEAQRTQSRYLIAFPGNLHQIIILFLLFFSTLNIAAQTPNTAVAHFERGRNYIAYEDWYSAIESFLEAIRLNPAHAEATAALAECYYELAEFDEALNWVRRARQLARNNMSVANLEAVIVIALGNLDAAGTIA